MGLSRQEYWSIPVVAISFSRGSSPPRDQTPVSRIAGRHFTLWATSTTLCTWLGKYKNYISQPPLQLTVVMWQDSGQWGTRYRDKCNFQVMTLKGQDMPFFPPFPGPSPASTSHLRQCRWGYHPKNGRVIRKSLVLAPWDQNTSPGLLMSVLLHEKETIYLD